MRMNTETMERVEYNYLLDISDIYLISEYVIY
jgi:hypothetical protein